jgi:UDP-N-acetylmuramyl pentapeptide phosphotransferase/UDP-N-acetylglucosamine-1-phosphate transferase
LFGVVWTLAAAGVALKAFDRLSHPWASTGLYLAMGWLVLIAAVPMLERVPLPGLMWLVAGGLAYVGWRDDRKPLSARLRFGVQIIVSLFSVSTLWALHPTDGLAIWYVPLLALAMTWFINLYNFMDGSDGLAGSQAVLGGLGIGALALAGGVSEIAATSFALAGASLGFLYWNWSPARIFMGDVGSYFLGGLFALLLLRGILSTVAPWRWLMVFAPFITDATLTLLARMLRRQRWWEAHREQGFDRLLEAPRHPRSCCRLTCAQLM